MSSTSSAATVEIALRPSLRALQWLLGLHVGAVALTFLATPPAWAGLALAAGFLLSWTRLRRHPAFGYGPRALTRIRSQADGDWMLELGSGTGIGAHLLPASVVWPTLLVLSFRSSDGRIRHRVLVGDETDADSLRRLRARLLNPPVSR